MPKIVKKYGKITLILGLILVLLGMYFAVTPARAGSCTKERDVLSDSTPSTVSNHTIYFVTPTGVESSTDTITITFASGFDLATNSVAFGDMDLAVDNDGNCDGSWTDKTLAATATTNVWGAAVASQVVTFTPPTNATTGEITAGYCVQIEIGTNASGGSNRIINPTAGVKSIDIAGNFGDTGSMKVAIISGVSVTATVAESLTFTISAVASGTVNGATINVATTDGVSVPFGTLSTSANSIAAHDLLTTTNATNGYTTTTQYNQKLRIDASNDIDDHSGTNASPSSFSSAGTEAFGYTTNDSSLGTGTVDRFTSGGGNKWAAFTTSPLEVAYSSTAASETTRIGYQAGISTTTPAGSYSTTVTYICTPTY